MAVYTEVSFDEAAALIDGLGLGALQTLAPCAGGIENTNYFADTAPGRYVLTVFERLTRRRAAVLPAADEAPRRPRHAGAAARMPTRPARSCSRSRASRPRSSTACPASTTSRPTPPTAPASARCSRACTSPARDFAPAQPNLRGLAWWNATVPVVAAAPRAASSAALMQDELAYQQHLAASPAYATLPRGAIHGDLFRDNVMFDGRRARPACSTSISPASTRCSSTSPSPSTTGASTSPRAASPRTAPRRCVAAYEARAAARERRGAPAAGADARRARSASGSRASGTCTCRATRSC